MEKYLIFAIDVSFYKFRVEHCIHNSLFHSLNFINISNSKSFISNMTIKIKNSERLYMEAPERVRKTTKTN